MFVFCLLFIGCKNDKDEVNSRSVTGTWTAISLIENAAYTDLGKEEYNEVEISYGSYVWAFDENGNIKVTGSVDGKFQWYNEGERPTDYRTFVFARNQMKLLMTFPNTSKSPATYDVLDLSDTEMILRDSAKWVDIGYGEIIVTRTLTLKKIN